MAIKQVPYIEMAVNEERMNTVFERVLASMYEGFSGTIITEMMLIHANEYLKGFRLGFGSTFGDIQYDQPDFITIEKMKSDMFRFSAAKNFQQQLELSRLLTNENGVRRSFDEFKELATAIHKDYNLNWLRTEYNTAKGQARMARQWFDAWANRDLYDLMYETAGDDKVRDDHEDLDGLTRPVEDSIWDKVMPKNDHGCRCGTRLVPKGNATPRNKIPKFKPPNGFDFNPGKQGLVFGDGHPVIERMRSTRAGQRLATKELEFDRDYGLHSLERIYKNSDRLTRRPADFTDKDDYFRYWREMADENSIALIDAVDSLTGKTKVIIDGELIDKLARRADRQGSRWQHFRRVKPTLTKPDEVYELRKNGRYTLRYVKFYDDIPFIVNVEQKADRLRVKTVYKLNLKDDPTSRDHRKGVLRYSK